MKYKKIKRKYDLYMEPENKDPYSCDVCQNNFSLKKKIQN